MKRLLTYIPAVALLLTLATTCLIHSAAAGKPPSDTPVTTTIDGLGVNTLPTLRIQSDQLGAYRNSASLSSIIQGIGDWELDMINFNSSPQRKALIDLRDPVPGSGPNGGAPTAPFAYQIVRARFISKCTQNGINMRTMQTNTPYYCPLAVAFDDAGGVRYRLAGNPTNFSETNLGANQLPRHGRKLQVYSMEDRAQRHSAEWRNKECNQAAKGGHQAQSERSGHGRFLLVVLDWRDQPLNRPRRRVEGNGSR